MLSTLSKLLVLTVSMLMMTTSLAATPVATVEVPLNGQSNEQITPLLTTGLTKVMARLTGNPQIAEQAAVLPLLKDPNAFIEHYKQQATPSKLSIAFDQAAITAALNKAGIATWTAQKPVILLWWITNQQTNTTLLDEAQTNTKIIQQAAIEEGLPLRIPLADLTEQALTDKAIFTAVKPDAIFQASAKYNANVILAVAANHTADNWQLNWRLWQANSSQLIAQGQTAASSLTEAAANLLAAINPPLAKIYVVSAGEAKKLTITFKQVNFSSYVQISKLMTSFKGRLLETNGSTVRYELTADPLQLQTQLELINFYPEQTKNQSLELVFVPH